MSDLRAPFTPNGCDLRGYDFMPSFGQRLFGSTFYGLALRNPRAGLAALKLWWEAWLQNPAASLPDDDFDLARLADFGGDIAAWQAVKETALHGFTKCSDGRLYHRFLATLAIDAYERRLKAGRKREGDRARLQAWRDAQKCDPKGKAKPDETPDETRIETPDETRFVAGRNRQGQRQVIEDSTLADLSKARPARAKGVAKDWSQDQAFAAFRAGYPKADRAPGRTYAAWLKALKIAPTAEIMAGLQIHPFNAEERFRPDPSTWLNGQSWRAAANHTMPARAPAPKPLRTACGAVLTSDDLSQVLT